MTLAGYVLLATPATAATLFGVVTERAAPLAAAAARQHLARHPGDRIVLRTTEQLMAASPAELAGWLRRADALLAVAVFGDPARRLGEAIPGGARAHVPLLAFNGEAGLSLQSRTARGSLAGLPAVTLRDLAGESSAAAPGAGQGAGRGATKAAAQSHPAIADWLAARATWQAGGTDNVARLLDHLLHGAALPAPTPEAALRLRLAGHDRDGAALWHDSGLPAEIGRAHV